MSTRKSKDQSAEQTQQMQRDLAAALLDTACAKVGKSRSQSGRNLPQGGILITRQGETIVLGKAEKELALNASGNVLFNAAVKYITREKHRHVKHAKEKFETVVRGNARALGYAEQETEALLAHWEKNGMPLNEVKWWRVLYDDKAYRHYRSEERAKKRKPRLDKKDKPVIREVNRDKNERDINVSDVQAKRLFRPKH